MNDRNSTGPASGPQEGTVEAGSPQSLYDRFDIGPDVAEKLYAARTANRDLQRRLTQAGSEESRGLQTPSPAVPVTDSVEDVVEEPPDNSLLMRIIDEFGDLTGKYNPPTALSTHTINAILVGMAAFSFDTAVSGQTRNRDERGRLLLAALALHDCNKYVGQRYPVAFADWLADRPEKQRKVNADIDAIRAGDASLRNSKPLLDFYFEQGDPLGLRFILPGETAPEIRADIADVKWLVQRTELYGRRKGTEGDATKRVRNGLYKYARIGDAFVSKQAGSDISEAVAWLEKFYRENGSDPVTAAISTDTPLQTVSLTPIEQPILNSQLIATAKGVIEGELPAVLDDDRSSPDASASVSHGVVIGSTPETIVYLGEPIDRGELAAAVSERLMYRVAEEFDFHCKSAWNSFEADILEEVSIPYEDKREKIRDGYISNLVGGSGLNGDLDDGFEEGAIPDGFADYLPELAHLIFGDGDEDAAFNEYRLLRDAVDHIKDGDRYNGVAQNMGLLAELLLRYTGQRPISGGTVDNFREQLEEALSPVTDDLRETLTPEVDAGELVVQRAFNRGVAAISSENARRASRLRGANESCFLCGRAADRKYKKGQNAFYGSNAFSKRAGAEEAYKRICPVCNLEHALLRDQIEEGGYNVGGDVATATVYYDSFLGNLGLGQGSPGELVRRLYGQSEAVDDDGDDATDRLYDVADPSITADSFGVQYHVVPLDAPGKHRRLAVTRELLETFVSRGFKVAIGKPFTPFKPRGLLFEDAEPTRRHVAFGADAIGSFEELRGVRRLLDILHRSDPPGDRFLAIGDDSFEQIAALVVEYGGWLTDDAHEYFIDMNDKEYTLMRDVAERGIDLYGKQYSSKQYKKVKLFRRALDATLDGLSDGLNEAELMEYVAGQAYAEADEEDYSGVVKPEQAEAFVAAIFEYLRESGAFNAEDLAGRRSTLVKVYEFAYDKAVAERDSDAEADTDAEADADDEGVAD